MSLSITTITRENGPSCNHLVVTVNDEGTPRTFRTSFDEIDAVWSQMSRAEQGKLLIMLWAKHRRHHNRPIFNVEIA